VAPWTATLATLRLLGIGLGNTGGPQLRILHGEGLAIGKTPWHSHRRSRSVIRWGTHTRPYASRISATAAWARKATTSGCSGPRDLPGSTPGQQRPAIGIECRRFETIREKLAVLAVLRGRAELKILAFFIFWQACQHRQLLSLDALAVTVAALCLLLWASKAGPSHHPRRRRPR
jgi:hypothetical protein